MKSDTVSTAEFAATHNVTPATVWRWIVAKKIKAVRVGRDWRVDPDSPKPDGKSGPKPKKASNEK